MGLLTAQSLQYFTLLAITSAARTNATTVRGQEAAHTQINQRAPSSFITLPAPPLVPPPPARKGFKSRIAIARINTSGPSTESSADKLKLSSLTIDVSDNIVEEFTQGLSEQRPEIISLMKMKPIYEGSPADGILSPPGKLIEVNYQAGMLQDDIIKKFLKDMTQSFGDAEEIETDAEKKFLKLVEVRKNELKSLSDSLSLFSELENTTVRFKNKLNPKNISTKNYQTDNYYSMKPFFLDKMQYTEEQWNKFSGTKIYLQLLQDFKYALTNYSLNLFDTTDADRANDFSPFDIDKSYGENVDAQSANLTMQEFTSGEFLTLKLAGNQTRFNTFLQRLPVKQTERMTMLMHLFGKELTVSRHLSPRLLRPYKEEFGFGDTGNPFDIIIGEPGDTIYEKPSGPESLAALAHVPVDNNPKLRVLPFEGKIVDIANDDISYLPGWQFFTDKLYRINVGENPTFDKKAVRKYTDDFKQKSLMANKAINGLLALDKNRGTESAALYKRLLSKMKDSSDDFRNNTSQPLMHALFGQAPSDPVLKKMLFEYCLFVGLSVETQSSAFGRSSQLFQDLAIEYNTLLNFSTIRAEARDFADAGVSISIVDNPNLDYSYWLGRFVRKIQKHIYTQLDVPEAGVDLVSTAAVEGGPAIHALLNVLEEVEHNGIGGQTISFRRNRDFIDNLKTISETTAAATNNYTLMNAIIDFTRTVSTKGNYNNTSWTLADGRTRFNFVSPSYQFLFIFEMFCTLIELYGHAEFKKASDGRRLRIDFNYRAQNNLNDIMNTVRRSGGNTNNLSSYKPEAKKKLANTSASTVGQSRHNGIDVTIAPKSNVWGAVQAAKSNNNTQGGTLFNPGACGVMIGTTQPSVTTSYPTQTWTNTGGWGGFSSVPGFGWSFPANYSWGGAGAAIGGGHGGWGGMMSYGVNWGATWSIGAASFGAGFNASYGVSFNPFAHWDSPTSATSYNLDDAKTTANLTSTIQKLDTEEAYLANMNYLVKLFRVRMQEGWDILEKGFNNKKLAKIIAQARNLSKDKGIATTTSKALRNLKNPAQLQTAAYNYLVYSEKFAKQAGENLNSFTPKDNLFLASESIDITQRDGLYKLLSYSMFNSARAKNLYLLSVGLPKNSVNFWKSRATVDSITELEGEDAPSIFKQKQSDIMKVKVYKRLLRYPDIVFEPQEFLFDTSLFVLPGDIRRSGINYQTSKTNLFRNLQVSDFSGLRRARRFNINNFAPTKLTTKSILTEQSYREIGLSTSDKKSLVTNQLTSYLLSLYIQLLTGMKISEETFIFDRITEEGTSKKFADVLISYMRDVLKEPISADITATPGNENTIDANTLINDPNISQDSRELLSIILKGNSVHKKGFLTNKVLSPKLFDRVFHIPVDIDDFSVDVDETNSTVPGQAAYTQALAQGLFEERTDDGVYFIGTNKIGEGQTTGNKEVIFDDLFITIESLV